MRDLLVADQSPLSTEVNNRRETVTMDQVSGADVPADDKLLNEIEEAFWGAYDATPDGEGVMGAAEFGCKAAALAARGLKAPEAVDKAIGMVGHYGVPRKYTLVLIQGPESEIVVTQAMIEAGIHEKDRGNGLAGIYRAMERARRAEKTP